MLRTLILAGEAIVAAVDPSAVQMDAEGWFAPGVGRWPRSAGVTGTIDLDVPAGFVPAAWLVRSGALISSGWTPPTPSPVLAHVSGWQACSSIIGVIGADRFATLYSDPRLLLLRIRIDTCRDVDPADMPAVFAMIASVDPACITADEQTAIMAAWPKA